MFGDLEDDKLFIKGMPIDESQINPSNLSQNIKNITKIFNSYNIDLMFMLSVVNIKIELRNLLKLREEVKTNNPVKSSFNNYPSTADTKDSTIVTVII